MIRRCVLLLVMVTVSASVGYGQRPSRGRPTPARGMGLDPKRMTDELSARLTQLKASHKALVDELTAIQKLLREQKSSEALAKCEALIATQKANFEVQAQKLERQLANLKSMAARRKPPERKSLVGRLSPMFEAQTLDEGTVDISQFRGKIIVLEWINFNCPYSRYHYKTKKTMIGLAKKYAEKGVKWVAVNSTHTTSPEAYQSFLKNLGLKELPYPVVDDRDGRIGKSFSARTTPQIIIIDQEGKVAFNGAVDNAPLGKPRDPSGKVTPYVDRAISELLEGRKVSILETELFGCTVKYASPEK